MFRLYHFFVRFLPILWDNFLCMLPDSEVIHRITRRMWLWDWGDGTTSTGQSPATIFLFFVGLHHVILWYQNRDVVMDISYTLGLIAVILGYIVFYGVMSWVIYQIGKLLKTSFEDYQSKYKHKGQ